MANKIVFFGSLPPKDESKVGGGEWGNFRTVKMLQGFGYIVKPIRKTNVKSTRSYIFKIITSPFRLLWDVFKVSKSLLISGRNVVLHFSGFAWKTIPLECIIIRIAKWIGCRLVYEIRGGGLIDTYKNGGNGYRNKLQYILTHADYIFSQGEENIPLINSLCATPVYHYANCVTDGFYPSSLLNKPKDKINLLYFGRISPDKNLSLIIEAARILQQVNKNITLTVIGNGQDQSYVNGIRDEIHSKLMSNSFIMIPGCQHDRLKELLVDKHFYIFPSQVVLEGQSNSVTEAMSYGIIPIASPQGFNRSTIGDDFLIVDELSSEAYAERINRIILEGKIEQYSRFVYNRFVDNYTESIVFERTKAVYQTIFDRK